jgi:hypothetical protein
MLPLNTLKSIRKWRDRLFMLGENALDRCMLRSGKKILFSPWPEVEAAVQRGFKYTRHTVEFGAIPPGGGNYDLVVPVSTEALIAATGDGELQRKNPLRFPSSAAVNLCDDKATLNAHLRSRGFARHIPGGEATGRFPYMLKRRRDSCARHAFRIMGPADEQMHREKIESPDYLRQDWIAGETEFSAHLLHIRGRVRRALSMSFRMHDAWAIRGRDPVLLMRRCHSRHVGLFEAMLNAAEFEGLCCVNYKIRDGIPMILEINPRFGFSLGPFFSAFMRSLEWK